jgi:quercetin dioxygenase-like cupin family protein
MGRKIHPFLEYSILVGRPEKSVFVSGYKTFARTRGGLRLAGKGREEYRRSHRAYSFCTEVHAMKLKQTGAACAALAVAIGIAVAVYGQEKKEAAATHKIIHSGDLKWNPIIRGCDIAMVEGDMNAEGQQFVLRFRCADGAITPAHWHPTDEYITVLKGAFLVGMGEKFDESKLQTMNPGNFLLVPKEMRHFGMAKGEMILQVHGMGPFKVNWVNPADVQPPDTPTKK